MLGNFSFGDYFKREAIAWAWEFLTKWLEIPENLLYPSIFENDEEAFEIWTKEIGVPKSHIKRLGKADNFWEHGQGPCGPCSEIYFDRGEKYGCGSPDCGPGCDCDRFMEIWNNVFSQFNNDGNGNYTELAQKNIDTGMGLERLACVMQGVDNLFEVDTVRKILNSVCSVAGKNYGDNAKDDISIRVVTDHIRSATFMICDGVIPSNEGRGYVLRRILRRASRHGKLLGINEMFLPPLCEVVIGENVGAYPELSEKREYILKVIANEEERFNATIDAGLSIISGIISDVKASGRTVISGADAFRLYDTFGFPIDLTREIADESGVSVDEAEFSVLMNEQRTRARAARASISGWSEGSKNSLSSVDKTEFVGYENDTVSAKVLAIIVDGEDVEEISEGDCLIVCDKTVFYGEGGGQVGDSGAITADGLDITVTDTKKNDGVYIHVATVNEGAVRVGDTVTLSIDVARRNAIRRNHSATHILQSALREVLGNHVEQSGSYVDERRLRFDFSHFSAITADEIAKIESIVNAHILSAADVLTVVTDIESAKKMGAMALFGEKYGKTVRVVKMGDFSTEFCGGTHVDNTGKIGLCRIISESSVAAGIRRIEATTGLGVLELMAEKDALILDTARELKANNVNDIAKKAVQLQGELREARREIDSLNSKISAMKLGELIGSAVDMGKVRLLTARLEMKIDSARALCDSIKCDYPDMIAVFAIVNDGKLNFITCAGEKAVSAGAHAGNILREVCAVCGGKGGGRADSAMSGGRDLDKIDGALALAKDIVSKL